MSPSAELLARFPADPCGMCGPPFASRHRTIDAIRDWQRAGDLIQDLAWDYDLPVELVEELCSLPEAEFQALRRMPDQPK